MTAASAVCFPSTNIAFIHKIRGQMNPMPAGQTFLYFGDRVEEFARRFSEFGVVSFPVYEGILNGIAGDSDDDGDQPIIVRSSCSPELLKFLGWDGTMEVDAV